MTLAMTESTIQIIIQGMSATRSMARTAPRMPERPRGPPTASILMISAMII